MSEANDVMSEVEALYADYGARAKELAARGKKIIGYICSFVPLEMITAAGCIPFRMRGEVHEPITKGDTLLETIVCPWSSIRVITALALPESSLRMRIVELLPPPAIKCGAYMFSVIWGDLAK